MQRKATEQVLSIYADGNKRAAPTAVVQPGTGRVLAMAVNRHYSVAANPAGQQNYPNTVNQLVAGGGGIVGYQAGSTFKLFTLLAALESGLAAGDYLRRAARIVTRYSVDGDSASCGGYWCPANANPEWMDGARTMWSAFGRSVNTYFAWLTEKVGADRVVEMAAAARHRAARRRGRRAGPVRREELGAVHPGRRRHHPARPGQRVRHGGGRGDLVRADCRSSRSATAPAGRWPPAEPDCRQVIDTEVARAARTRPAARSATSRCTGAATAAPREELRPGCGRPVAGKTGSSERNETETVVAFTPQLAVATIAANPDDPRDAVGGGVQARMVDAVGNILAVRPAATSRSVDFVPPNRSPPTRHRPPHRQRPPPRRSCTLCPRERG